MSRRDSGILRVDRLASEAAGLGTGGPRWRYIALLTALSVVGLLMALPYSFAIVDQLAPVRRPRTARGIGLATLGHAGVSFLIVLIGLALGRHLRLGWPPIAGWEAGENRGARIQSALRTAGAAGVASALLLAAITVVMPEPVAQRRITTPGPWQQALASIGAGMNEEIWFRLGGMTLFAWAGSKVIPGPTPNPAVMWGANALAALAFGAAHLPQAARLYGLEISTVSVVLVGNGAVGLVCGWLYWRKGIFAAMAGHATTNLVLRLILAPLGRGL